MNNIYKILSFIILYSSLSNSQEIPEEKHIFDRQDTLRGSVTKERVWWDLQHYHLNIKVDPDKKTINGYNEITYLVLDSYDVIQIDLQKPLVLYRAEQNNERLDIVYDGNAHFIKLKEKQLVGEFNKLKVFYGGFPREAPRAPWDGGISWEKDKNGNHFVASSCQGLGASIWWPNKDHMYDEPDSGALISVNVPKGLFNVSNGKLKSIEHFDLSSTFHWEVINPINNYGININIGDYTNFSKIYDGENGDLMMDYYVLSHNLEKAKTHFKDAERAMEAFEYWFGPYPFYDDSFKLVETPYLGMEHQSSITYGNQYKMGYLGRDLSGTGWGLKFDFIIVHEMGHEWFANNITYIDIADMWIHEGFTTYSENLFVEYYYGKKAGSEYVTGQRKNIKNQSPIIGTYNVNKGGSSDMYSKGANMLHTLRQLADNDESWRNILRGLNKDFYHKTVSSKQVEDYLSIKLNRDLESFFDQYLRDTRIPLFAFKFNNGELIYRWEEVVEGFDMPIEIIVEQKNIMLYPTKSWKKISIESNELEINRNYYVNKKEI